MAITGNTFIDVTADAIIAANVNWVDLSGNTFTRVVGSDNPAASVLLSFRSTPYIISSAITV